MEGSSALRYFESRVRDSVIFAKIAFIEKLCLLAISEISLPDSILVLILGRIMILSVRTLQPSVSVRIPGLLNEK